MKWRRKTRESSARITAIHRHYWPDTPPYASMLRSIVAAWKSQNAHCEIVTAQPSYRSAREQERPRVEAVDGVRVERVAVASDQKLKGAKVVNLALFPLEVLGVLARRAIPDVVMCSTAPQVTLGFAVSTFARLTGSSFVYHCMDLHPEIGRLSGEFAHPLVYRVLMAMDTTAMRRAARVVVLSEDMRESVLRRDPKLDEKIVVLNNFALPDFDPQQRADSLLPPAENGWLRVVFTGNIGRFQGLNKVVDAAMAAAERVELVFMGEGNAKAALAARTTDDTTRIVVLDHDRPARARALMATAHLGLVSLAPDVIRYAYPSKTATYMCEGLPVLAACELDTQLVRDIRTHQIGWAGNTVEELTVALSQAASAVTDGEIAQVRDRVANFAAREFDEARVLDCWNALLKDIIDERKAHRG